MSSLKKDPKKIPKKIQPTLFGVQKFQITQKLTKRVGKNEYKVVNEFVRVENSKNGQIGDVFRSKCDFCMKSFKTPNALGAHKKH